jgi:hypothetical protein
MRFLPWLTLLILVSMPDAFAEDVDLDKLARPEREQLARCMSDTLTVIEKHRLGKGLMSLSDLFDATCGMEIERVTSAAENQLKDDLYKKLLPGQLICKRCCNSTMRVDHRRSSVMPSFSHIQLKS